MFAKTIWNIQVLLQFKCPTIGQELHLLACHLKCSFCTTTLHPSLSTDQNSVDDLSDDELSVLSQFEGVNQFENAVKNRNQNRRPVTAPPSARRPVTAPPRARRPTTTRRPRPTQRSKSQINNLLVHAASFKPISTTWFQKTHDPSCKGCQPLWTVIMFWVFPNKSYLFRVSAKLIKICGSKSFKAFISNLKSLGILNPKFMQRSLRSLTHQSRLTGMHFARRGIFFFRTKKTWVSFLMVRIQCVPTKPYTAIKYYQLVCSRCFILQNVLIIM